MKRSPGRYQELDLFIKVLRLLCPNLTDASPNCFPIEDWIMSRVREETVWLDFVHEASGFFFQPSVGLYSPNFNTRFRALINTNQRLETKERLHLGEVETGG